jgi:DNA-binding beta-propeller fold protein YncE
MPGDNMGRRLLVILAAWLTASACWVAVAGPDTQPATRLRRPIDAAFLADGHTLCVANQRSGTFSLVDVAAPRLIDEFDVGQHLAGLAVLPDRKHVLAVDDAKHELIALSADGTRLAVRTRLAVGPYPVSVAVQPDGARATVASLWSRRVEVVDLAPLSSARPATLRVLHTVRLPFAPRLQLALPKGSQVVVADAFGGHLAVVDAAAGRLVAVHELTGHNLRGLALSADGKRLLVSHQVLDQKAPTTRENVERGVLMSNVLCSIPLDRVLDPRANLNEVGRVTRLGAGAGDPAGVAVLDADHVAVALAGVNEVALLPAGEKKARRVAVGRRPTVLVGGTGGQPLVALNTSDDSLSLLDAARGSVLGTVSLGPRPKLDYADRGELLFFDARLSRGGGVSCHSCHTDGHTNGLLADTLGDKTFGTPKRTLTLMNTRLTDPWGWNGEVKYLHDQVRKSLLETMHDPALTEDHVGDLTSFLSTLPPPPPPEPVTAERSDRERVERGRRVFEARGCARCHIPPLTYSSGGVYDVGFADEKGLRKFNPPSLRGVGQGYRFLHDGRAATLEEVFTKFGHKVDKDTPQSDIDDLLRFLRSL